MESIKILFDVKDHGKEFSRSMVRNPHEVRELPIIGIFKSKLLSLIRPPLKPVSCIHDPKVLQYSHSYALVSVC